MTSLLKDHLALMFLLRDDDESSSDEEEDEWGGKRRRMDEESLIRRRLDKYSLASVTHHVCVIVYCHGDDGRTD